MDYNHHDSVQTPEASCCTPKNRTDYLLWGSIGILVLSFLGFYLFPDVLLLYPYMAVFAVNVVELLYKMWWGILLGILSVGVLNGIPREMVVSVLGKGGTFNGIIRATFAGLFLDLCSHGILLVGMQLYKRGASLGQLMAFLIASPWNSLSLTLILWSLVGFPWMITIVLLSLLIALISGWIFELLTAKNVLPKNPHSTELPDNYQFWKELKRYIKTRDASPRGALKLVLSGVKESKMILRWIFFGIVLAALIRAGIPGEMFASLFAPTLLGLGATLIFATILEVCSEGSMPVAADFLLRAKAAGNTFAFLMTGVSTDYTEIMALKETTGSWKISFFLPLVTLPQVILISIILNQTSF